MFRGWFRARNHVWSNRDLYAILYIWKKHLKRLPVNEFLRSKRLKSMFLRSFFVLGGLGGDLAASRGWFRARNHVWSNRDLYAILYIWKNHLKRLPINEFWRSKRLKSMFLRSCFVLGGLEGDLSAFRGWFGARYHVWSNRNLYVILYIWKNHLKRLPISVLAESGFWQTLC